MYSTESQIVDNHITATNELKAPAEHLKMPTMYWLPKLHKKPFKFRFISASSKCTTTKISVLLTSALSKLKELITNYCNKAFEHNGVNYFWSVKNSLEVLDKLHAFDKPVETLNSYDFSTLYTTLPHYLIKQKFSDLIKWFFDKSDGKYICCNKEKSFFSNEKDKYKRYTYWTCEEMIDSLNFLLDNIYIRFGEKTYRQVVGIPMGTNCAPLIADLFLYCYESQFMAKLHKNSSNSDLIDKFNNTYRYLDDIFALNNSDFYLHISDIYPKELTLNKANEDTSNCPFLDLNISILQGKIKTKIYDKRDDFSFPIVNFPFLDGDVPLAPSYGVYISQLVRFARVCSDVSNFNERNLCITEKLLSQGFRYHKLVKTFSKFYRKYKDLLLKFGCTCKNLIKNGISHPSFYGNVVNKARKFKFNPFGLHSYLNKLIRKGYHRTIIVKSLYMVFLDKNIDRLINNLLQN